MSSNSNLERCDIGIKFDQPWHKQSYCKKMDILWINRLQQYEREVVKWRTVIQTNTTLCLHLKEVFLKIFAASEKNCCDPFSQHANSAVSRKRKGNIISGTEIAVGRLTLSNKKYYMSGTHVLKQDILPCFLSLSIIC